MSLWLKRKDKDGKTKMYVVPFGATIIFMAAGVVASLILFVIACVAMIFSG